jgi:hypothetical protein
MTRRHPFGECIFERFYRVRLVSQGLSVIVRDGIVHLTCIITDERSRQAAIVGAAVTWLFAACVLQIRVGHLTKPAEHMLAI